ncbi:MAG: hypothetical protein U0X73_07065 [Thermoanaerobaculia bacterium]
MDFGERFLVYPDLFPARPGGATWGVESLDLDFVGGLYRVAGLAAAQRDAIASRFAELVVAPGEQPPVAAAVTLHLYSAPESDFHPVDFTGLEYTFDLDPLPAAVRVAGLRFMAWVDPTAARIGIWTSAESLPEFLGIFENCFRLAAAYRLPRVAGALLHSAGIGEGGRAWLAFGASGAGKTTIARKALAAGAEILSDDLNALAERGGELVVERLPFAGDLGATAGARGPALPVAGLLRLERGEELAVERLRPAAALGALLAASPFVNVDPHRRPALEEALAGWIERVPVARLATAVDTPWSEIKKAIATL